MMTIKNKILAILLAMSFNAFAAAWTGSTSEPENMKKIDGKAFYVITTADELAWFAAQVNAGQTTINAVLGKDIVFGASSSKRSTQKWVSIGVDSSTVFNGTLDGAGHTIYGLYVVAGNRFSGLVGVLGSGGIVRNIKLKNGELYVQKNVQYAGSFVGFNNGVVQNCVGGDSLRFGSSTAKIIGGIVGENAGIVDYCISEAVIDSFDVREGSGTELHAQIEPPYMFGGVAGFNLGTIQYSSNKTDWMFYFGYGKTYLGGIVGSNAGKITRSENNAGQIKRVTNSVDTAYVGGAAGFNNGGGMIENVVNNASVVGGTSGPERIGGIVGYNNGNVQNSFVTCGRVYGGTNGNHAGGIAAYNSKTGVISNVFFDANKLKNIDPIPFPASNSKGTLSNVSGMTTANMQKDQFAWILNTTNGTASNSGVWSRSGGYPIFADESNRAIYKIVFNDDGVTSNRYNTNKGTVSFPEDPEPAEGYIFTGWYNSSDVRVKPTTIFSADQTVNAVYADASNVFWTINFYNSDAKTTLLETKSYQHGSIVAYEGETPTRETTAQYTYTFKGWDVELTNAVEDFDYHAVYDSTIRSYTIVFNNSDGSKIESATFEYGKMPSCSKTPTRVATAEWNWAHKGWKPALDYVTGEATYVATYDSNKVEYKVTFLNGTTVIDEQMIPYGGAAVAPTNVTRDGYKFVGWNTTFSNVTENLTVKALFEELITYIVKVDGPNGEKIDSAKIEENGTYVLPTAPKKDGYTFDAYYDGDNKIGTAGTEITVVSDITITAKYSKNPESSSSSVPKSSSSSTPKSSSSVKSSSSDGGSQVVIEGELEQTVSPGAYIDPIIFKNVKTYKRNSTQMSFLQALPSSGGNELAIVGVVPESYKAGVYTDSLTINGSKYKIKLTVVANVSSSSVKSSSSSVKTSIAMKNIMPQFNVKAGFHSVQILGAKVGTSYALLDMQGRVLKNGRVESANFDIAVANAGRYFVKIGDQIRNVNIR